MTIKKLIKEVERLQKGTVCDVDDTAEYWITHGIKQTVEAVDDWEGVIGCGVCLRLEKDWQRLKKLLGVRK